MARSASSPLQSIPPDRIKPNADNPRLIFREEDMTELLESIKEVGIRVPISVYSDGAKFVLLDGERRWRCAKRLNLRELPAIVQPKPTRLENLLMMFNIHNVRVDWDLMPMALKLGEIRQMLEDGGKDTSAKSLSAITGVRLPTVRRALELLALPVKYQRMLLREAEKPRNEQRIKADLFVEIHKAYHAVERYNEDIATQVGKSKFVDVMVKKYLDGVVDNVVSFREISKIARATLTKADASSAREALIRLVREPQYSISAAYEDTVQAAYVERDIGTRARGLTEKLQRVRRTRQLSDETREALARLRDEIERVLGV
jgi:ParB family transcriptional regulator, chromosome partitioning protein